MNKDFLENLQSAKQEARNHIRRLSDDELAEVSGGKGFIICPCCRAYIYGADKCFQCGTDFGDEREDMDEALADVVGLMEDVDGFAD